jgi:uncharacterized membrane protein YcaP (DUF421 family)
MNAVLRATLIYAFVWLLFRIGGKRTLAQATPFDLVLLLMISEAAQEALVGDDHSITHAIVLIATFVFIDLGLSLAKQWWPIMDPLLDSEPLVIVAEGRPIAHRMQKERVSEGDVLNAARKLRGLTRLDQIRYAVLESTGDITVIGYERNHTPGQATVWPPSKGRTSPEMYPESASEARKT